MKGLSYLFITRIKNSLKELVRHPSKLILYIFCLAMLVFVFFTSRLEGIETSQLRDMAELRAMVLALYTFIFILTTFQGLSSGGTFYSMADVNLLFSTPISPRRILTYGIVRQMGTSLLVGFFIFFQYGWMHQQYGLDLPGILIIVLGYGATMFVSNLTAIAIYSFTSTSEGRQKILRLILEGVCVAAVGYVVLPLFWDHSHILETLVARMDSPVLRLFPVSGWAASFTDYLMMGQWAFAMIGLALLLGFSVLVFLLLSQGKCEFYEDVLQATEVSAAAITAKKEGKLDGASLNPRHVKLGKTGLSKGRGASAFFYKHLLESRRGRVFLLDKMTLLFAVCTVVFAFFIRDAGLLPIFVFAAYMQVFSISFGQWARELTMPYVYLSPAPAFKKLVMICAQSIFQMLLESTLIFVVAGIMAQASIWDIVGCIIARVSMGLLFLAANILLERLVGSAVNKTITMMLYFLAVIILIIPGAVAAIVLGVMLQLPVMLPSFLVLTVCNTAIAALIGFLCRDVLNYAELNNR